MVRLERIRSLLTNHVDGVLDPTVRDHRDHGSVRNTQITNAVNLQLGVHDTLFDALRQSGRATRVERRLAAVQHGALHLLVRLERHVPGILSLDERAEGLSLSEDVIGEADTLAHRENVEVVGEEVEVDVCLLEGVCAVEGDGARLGDGAHQVDDYGDVLALLGGGEVPLEGTAEHADEVQLEVRLALWREWVLATVGCLGLAVLLVLFEVVVDTGEADQLEQAGAGGAGVVLLVGLDGGFVLGALAQQDVVHAVAILDLEHKRDTWVVNEVLADVARVDNSVDAMAVQLAGGADTAKLEQLGGLEDTLGQDNFAASVEDQLFASGVIDDHTAADAIGVVDDEALGAHLRDDGDIGLVLQEEITARPHTLIDRVGAVGETEHLTVVDIFSDGVTLLGPGLTDGFTEGLHVIEQLSVGDVDRATTGANLGQVLWIPAQVVVVGGTLPEVRHKRIPGPFLASIFFPSVEGRLAAGHPGEVVQRRATTQSLTASVGLLDTLVVVALDHGGLVGPVVIAVPELHGYGGRGDLLNLLRVANTSLDDEHGHIGVFGQTTGDGVTSSTTAHDDEVIVGVVLGRHYGERSRRVVVEDLV